MIARLRDARSARRVNRRLSLSPPPPALQIVEDNLVTSAGGDELPISPSQRTIGPPAVLDQPRLADSVDGSAVDDQRVTFIAGADGDAAGNGKATRSAHRCP